MPTDLTALRIGTGYDIHRMVAGRPLILGGITIPFDRGLLGHSDADVVLHALADALLGAAGLGDIGEQFPDSDPAYRDADSSVLLRRVIGLVHQRGFTIINADIILHAQYPRLTPFKPAIRDSVAKLLNVPTDRIGLKARTNEELGEIGRGEAMACWASVLVIREQ